MFPPRLYPVLWVMHIMFYSVIAIVNIPALLPPTPQIRASHFWVSHSSVCGGNKPEQSSLYCCYWETGHRYSSWPLHSAFWKSQQRSLADEEEEWRSLRESRMDGMVQSLRYSGSNAVAKRLMIIASSERIPQCGQTLHYWLICKTSQQQALFPCLRLWDGRMQDQWHDLHQSQPHPRGRGVLKTKASDRGLTDRQASN